MNMVPDQLLGYQHIKGVIGGRLFRSLSFLMIFGTSFS